MRDGFLYTEEDFYGDIERNFDDPERVDQAIQTIRDLFSDGWTYTYFDLIQDLSPEVGSAPDIEALRFALSRVRDAVWVVSLLVAVGLAALWLAVPSERHVKTAWLAAALAAGFLAALLFFGVGHFAADAVLEAARAAAVNTIDTSGDFAGTQAVALPWMFDILQSSVGGYTAGVAVASGVLAAVALGSLAASLRWPQLGPLARRYVWPRRG